MLMHVPLCFTREKRVIYDQGSGEEEAGGSEIYASVSAIFCRHTLPPNKAYIQRKKSGSQSQFCLYTILREDMFLQKMAIQKKPAAEKDALAIRVNCVTDK